MSREIITTNCIILSLDHQPIPFGRRFTVISDKYLILVYDGNRNRNNKEISENVFRPGFDSRLNTFSLISLLFRFLFPSYTTINIYVMAAF